MSAKIIPITGAFTTFSSMLARIMVDPTVERGIVFTFDAAGTMSTGEVDMTRNDTCMVAAYAQMLAIEMMRLTDHPNDHPNDHPDDNPPTQDNAA